MKWSVSVLLLVGDGQFALLVSGGGGVFVAGSPGRYLVYQSAGSVQNTRNYRLRVL